MMAAMQYPAATPQIDLWRSQSTVPRRGFSMNLISSYQPEGFSVTQIKAWRSQSIVTKAPSLRSFHSLWLSGGSECTTYEPLGRIVCHSNFSYHGLKWRHRHFLANIRTMATVLKLAGSVQLPKLSSCFASGCLRRQSVVPTKRMTTMAARRAESTVGISETFAELWKGGKVAFVPYITAGDPDCSTTTQALTGLDSYDSDIIDLGIPYSDPLANGPVIQAAATPSLAWDCAFGAVMSTSNEVVAQLSSLIALFSNYNPILKLGIEKVMSTISDAGVSGLHSPTVYDTVISYKRDDTLHPMSHLKSALDRREIRTFIDFAMDGGVKFRPAINRAIEQSKSAVVVISPNFHSSPWCLDEVVKILQCHERWGLKVLPIFWGIDARELREQSRLFEENIGQGEKGFKQENPQQVLKWRNALRTLGMFNGWPVNSSLYRTEAEVIEDLAARILKSLSNSEEPQRVRRARERMRSKELN